MYNIKSSYPITSNGIINIKINTKSVYYNCIEEVINDIQTQNILVNINHEIKNNFNQFVDLTNTNDNLDLNYLFNNIQEDLKNNVYFLFIRRKFSIEYTEIIKGKYNDYSFNKLINYMTPSEIYNIKYNDFDNLWFEFWNLREKNKYDIVKFNKYYNQYNYSKNKFNKINRNFINEKVSRFSEPEWGFPKGRKNKNESKFDCAKREFEEETFINNHNIIKNIEPINEVFFGTNNIRYKHSYYISIYPYDTIIDKSFVKFSNEISEIEWFNYYDSLNIIRLYHVKKKNIINKIILFLSIKIYLSIKKNLEKLNYYLYCKELFNYKNQSILIYNYSG